MSISNCFVLSTVWPGALAARAFSRGVGADEPLCVPACLVGPIRRKSMHYCAESHLMWPVAATRPKRVCLKNSCTTGGLASKCLTTLLGAYRKDHTVVRLQITFMGPVTSRISEFLANVEGGGGGGSAGSVRRAGTADA